ncbi:UDP-4-amino-4,6-dideoxy-N-acetyl-beta-L-altrosamine transaminase [Patescibacteria group bacterium]|nr:UDP-4-amino-4,6-dideoxy-N-acetyl-beta-L-altrosamine transaminase [Patescibacteria group bacterium]
MAKIPIISYGHQSIDDNDIKEVVKVLKSDLLTQGPKVEEFEKAVARYCGAKYGVAVSSGTAALHLAYIVAGIKSGDEIITTPLTFAATANMLAVLGAKPVFIDIKSDTLNINPDLIEEKITKKTKAIVTVDFAGHPCDYDEILKIAKKHNLLVIEDACHALGAKYKGKKVGSFADMTILSFHPVKHITTGEGGMILTDNKDFYKKLKTLRHHGIVKKPEKGGWYYEIENPGYNYRITDFQCALGLSQLKKINRFIKRRREIVVIYNRAFKNIKEIITPTEKDYVKSSWHIYPIQLRWIDKRKTFDALQKQGIGVQVHYMPLHLHPFYQKKFRYKNGDFPVAEKYYGKEITLPLFPSLAEKDIKKVIKEIKKIIN